MWPTIGVYFLFGRVLKGGWSSELLREQHGECGFPELVLIVQTRMTNRVLVQFLIVLPPVFSGSLYPYSTVINA